MASDQPTANLSFAWTACPLDAEQAWPGTSATTKCRKVQLNIRKILTLLFISLHNHSRTPLLIWLVGACFIFARKRRWLYSTLHLVNSPDREDCWNDAQGPNDEVDHCRVKRRKCARRCVSQLSINRLGAQVAPALETHLLLMPNEAH